MIFASLNEGGIGILNFRTKVTDEKSFTRSKSGSHMIVMVIYNYLSGEILYPIITASGSLGGQMVPSIDIGVVCTYMTSMIAGVDSF